MAHTLRALLCAAALAWAGAAPAQTAQPPLPTITLNAGIHVIRAEVAQSQDERATGLMFRPVLAPNDGMLFAFEHADCPVGGHDADSTRDAHAVRGDDDDCVGVGGLHAAGKLLHSAAGGRHADGVVTSQLGDYFATVRGYTGID